jgi:hypothetical protein
MRTPKLLGISTKRVVIIRVSYTTLNWITDQSGFDWLYDYEFNSPRVLTAQSFLTNRDDPSEEFKAFCKRVKGIMAGKPKGTLILFQPPKGK